MVGMPQRESTGQISGFLYSLIFRSFWVLTLSKLNLKVVLELLLDIPEMVLEVLDLSWRYS